MFHFTAESIHTSGSAAFNLYGLRNGVEFLFQLQIWCYFWYVGAHSCIDTCVLCVTKDVNNSSVYCICMVESHDCFITNDFKT